MIVKEIWLNKWKAIVKMDRYKERDKAMKDTASSKMMREIPTRKQMRDQYTKDKYQQWINS